MECGDGSPMKKLLMIDDFFGRSLAGGRHLDRESLCRRLGLVEEGVGGRTASKALRESLGTLSFFRGQKPEIAKVGDTVENDLEGCIERIRTGASNGMPWDMLILDLCFYTGHVTKASNSDFAGFPEGRPEDDDPERFFGLTLLSAIKEQFPMLPVVIFSAYDGEQIRSMTKDLGANGYIRRDDPGAREILVDAIATMNDHASKAPVKAQDSRTLLELARSLPLPSLSELRNVLPILKELEVVLLRRVLHGALTCRQQKRISLLPAMKLISGRGDLTTSQAADLVKRLVHQTRPYEAMLLSDPAITAAYDMAVRLRSGRTASGK
jgi:DNA-binding NarL/FixJ family response regulator